MANDGLSRDRGARVRYPFFTRGNSAEAVNARMGPAADERLRTVMAAIVRHLHAAIEEIQLTQEEWLTAVRFLTKTGQQCNEWRQEFILLSDVLGVSMLVDAINHRRPAGATENTILGPFYLPNAPRYPHGTNICFDAKGEPLVVRGTVRDVRGKPIGGALIDVWQCNDEGYYDVQQKGIQPDWNLRGIFESDADGRYWYGSIMPRFYPIPHDGPVGRLLSELDRLPNRAAHIHFIVTAPGYDPVTTHVFTPDCPYLDEDAVFGVKPSLVGDFKPVADIAGTSWLLEWDFVLTAAREGNHSGAQAP